MKRCLIWVPWDHSRIPPVWHLGEVIYLLQELGRAKVIPRASVQSKTQRPHEKPGFNTFSGSNAMNGSNASLCHFVLAFTHFFWCARAVAPRNCGSCQVCTDCSCAPVSLSALADHCLFPFPASCLVERCFPWGFFLEPPYAIAAPIFCLSHACSFSATSFLPCSTTPCRFEKEKKVKGQAWALPSWNQRPNQIWKKGWPHLQEQVCEYNGKGPDRLADVQLQLCWWVSGLKEYTFHRRRGSSSFWKVLCPLWGKDPSAGSNPPKNRVLLLRAMALSPEVRALSVYRMDFFIAAYDSKKPWRTSFAWGIKKELRT